MISLRSVWGVASICIGLLVARTACAQDEYQWTVYSALNSAQSVAFDGEGSLWIATTGGVVGYTPANDSYQIYHTRDEVFPENEGLLSLNSTAIAFDPGTGDMYVGSDDGLVSIRKKSGRWSYSAEISAMSERPSRSIKGFGFHNGRVYILTAFGIGVYNPVDSSFIESYLRLSQSIPQNTAINAIAFWNGSIWAGTEKGLVRGPDNGTNLAATDAWEPFPLGATAIYSLAQFGDSLIVGTDSGAYMIGAGGGAVRRGDLPNVPVRVAVAGNHLLAATADQIYRYEGTSFTGVTGAPDQIRAIAVAGDGKGGVGFPNKGFALLDGNTLAIKRPNAPAGNLFSNLALTTDGAVWAASADQPSPGAGVSRLKDGNWTIFNKENTPEIKTDKIWHVGAGVNGEAFVGTFGDGLVVIKPVDTGFQSELFNTKNTPAVGINGGEFLVVGKAITDLNGRTWFPTLDPGATSGPVLLVRLRPGEQSHDGSGFEGFEMPRFGLARKFQYLAIDDNGTKWMGSDLGGTGIGLMYYNDRGTPTDPTDGDKSEVVTADRGLPSNAISTLIVDKLGELWVGTPRGIAVMVNPGSVVFNDVNPIFRTIRPLTDIYVRDIAVDALNRKWVGTDQGVFLLSAEGDQVLARFTTENSPLVNNQIRSILSVDASGDIYIGTTNGMNRVTTTAVEPPSDPQQLIVSPHPFVIPSSEPLRIKGLPANATIKIFGVGGTMVREFQSPGGAVALWDGLDNTGNPVPSGVYIIAAGASSGDNAVLGKVAVIRQ